MLATGGHTKRYGWIQKSQTGGQNCWTASRGIGLQNYRERVDGFSYKFVGKTDAGTTRKELVENELKGSRMLKGELQQPGVAQKRCRLEDGCSEDVCFDGWDWFEGSDGFDGCGDGSELEEFEQRDGVECS